MAHTFNKRASLLAALCVFVSTICSKNTDVVEQAKGKLKWQMLRALLMFGEQLWISLACVVG